jgi:hypothetical protein
MNWAERVPLPTVLALYSLLPGGGRGLKRPFRATKVKSSPSLMRAAFRDHVAASAFVDAWKKMDKPAYQSVEAWLERE